MRTQLTLSLGLLAGALFSTSLTAQDADGGGEDAGLHGRIGFDITSQYFFRGIRQERSGVITQPWFEFNYDLIDSDSGLQDLKVVFGQWNSLHSGRTGAANYWYESRAWVGVEAQVADRWDLGARLNIYSGPNAFFTGTGRAIVPTNEVQFHAAFDDKGVFFEDLQLNPHATLAFEVSGGRDGGGDSGIYFETGVAPSFELTQIGDQTVTLSLPTKIGLSFGDYYERPTAGGGGDDFFGYFQTGGELSMPLDCLSKRLGPWEVNTGLHLIVLGDNQDARNGGDSAELFFTFGMSTTF